MSFTGYLRTTDRATRETRPPAAAQRVGRTAVFDDLVLADVEPAACLAGLGAVTREEPGIAEPVGGR